MTKDQLPPLIDSHCHLTENVLSDDIENCLIRVREAGLCAVISVGIDPDSSRRAVKQAESYPEIYATVGLHPHDASSFSEKAMEIFERMTEHPKVVAIGETGLDYHYEFSPRENQKEAFANHVLLAREKGLPLVVHSRDAVADCIEIVRKYGKSIVYGVFHCFSGTESEAKEIMELGFYLSFAGNVTFKGFEGSYLYRLPLDRILIETDAPYLAPVPHRGKTNEPAFLPGVLKGMSRFIKSEELERIAAFTTSNAVSLFGIENVSGGKILDLLQEYID
jgi:TatD DNase family protein